MINKFIFNTVLILFAISIGCAKDVAHKYVVLYSYASMQDSRGTSIIMEDGGLNCGVLPQYTTRLDQLDDILLKKMLDGGKPSIFTGNGIPTHAIVFYDEQWKPVAWIEIDIKTKDVYCHPTSYMKRFNVDQFYKISGDLGIPVNLEASKEFDNIYMKNNSFNIEPRIYKGWIQVLEPLSIFPEGSDLNIFSSDISYGYSKLNPIIINNVTGLSDKESADAFFSGFFSTGLGNAIRFFPVDLNEKDKKLGLFCYASGWHDVEIKLWIKVEKNPESETKIPSGLYGEIDPKFKGKPTNFKRPTERN